MAKGVNSGRGKEEGSILTPVVTFAAHETPERLGQRDHLQTPDLCVKHD